MNCCTSQHTEGGRALVEWHYPDGSRLLSLYEISCNDSDTHVCSDGIFVNRSQAVIRLFDLAENGRYSCEIPDQHESNQILCVNIGKRLIEMSCQ